MYSIYKHTFPDGKVYIGCTSVRPELRYGRDGEGYSNQKKLWDAIQECGWVNVQHEILRRTSDREQAGALEQAYIQEYDSTNPDRGYNTRSGGLGRPMGELPPGTGQKISEGKTGAVSVHKDGLIRYVRPESLAEYLELGWERGGGSLTAPQKENLRQKNLGKTASADTRAKLSEQRTGLVNVHKNGVLARAKGERLEQLLSEGWVRGMPPRVVELNRESHRGVPVSAESRRKHSEVMKGRNVGKRQIHKAGVRKMVPASELNQYLQNGWELGTGRR